MGMGNASWGVVSDFNQEPIDSVGSVLPQNPAGWLAIEWLDRSTS